MHKWVLVPLLYTAIITGLSYYFSDCDFGIAMGMTMTFGLVMFAIYDDANRRVKYNEMFETKDVYTREGRRLAKAGMKFKPTTTTPIMLLAGTSLAQIFKGIYSAMLYTATWKCVGIPVPLCFILPMLNRDSMIGFMLESMGLRASLSA